MVMSEVTVLRRGGRFVPGQSGNIAGRPKGGRPKLGEAFFKTVLADFESHGKEAVEKLRSEKPDLYFKLLVFLLPKGMAEAGGADEQTLRVIERRIVHVGD
jgi:hypothetical protein